MSDAQAMLLAIIWMTITLLGPVLGILVGMYIQRAICKAQGRHQHE